MKNNKHYIVSMWLGDSFMIVNELENLEELIDYEHDEPLSEIHKYVLTDFQLNKFLKEKCDNQSTWFGRK